MTGDGDIHVHKGNIYAYMCMKEHTQHTTHTHTHTQEHIGQCLLYEGLQTSPVLKDVVDQVVSLLVLVKQQQLTEVHSICSVSHPMGEKTNNTQVVTKGTKDLVTNDARESW